MKKAFLVIFMIIVSVNVMFSVKASAETSGSCGDSLTWKLTDDGCLTISGVGEMYDFTSGKKAPWYSEKDTVKSVIIENGVSSIGNRAFYNCSNLTDVSVSNSVKSIGDSAFHRCKNLIDIVLSENIERIGESAFEWCSALAKISFPNKITTIESYVLSSCESLVSVDLPVNVDSIKDYAFYQCSNLANISIPDTLTSIGEYAFSGCENLKDIVLPETLENIGKGAFVGCASFTQFSFPSKIKILPYGVLLGCENLVHVELPKNVTLIGENAFSRCSNLTNIIIPDGLNSIDDFAFHKCKSLTDIKIPDTVINIGRYAFAECDSLKTITIPDSVTSISEYLFSSCDELETVNLSNSVLDIQGYAFNNCKNLVNLTGAYSVKDIGERAFYKCGKLSEIDFLKNIVSIGDYAFYDCKSLKNAVVFNIAEHIGQYAFYNCKSLKNATIPNTVEYIGQYAFYDAGITEARINCEAILSHAFCGSSIKTLHIGNNVKTIENSAFSSCEELRNITFDYGLATIGESAFASCDLMTSVLLPDSIEEIGVGAFRGCTELQGINIPKNVTRIEAEAFYGCRELSNIEIPNGVFYIGDEAFRECTALDSVVIPASVTEIGEIAFYDTTLTSVVIRGNLETIPYSSFSNTINLNECTLESIYIPKSVKFIEGDAIGNSREKLTIHYEGTIEEWKKIQISSDDNSAIKIDNVIPNQPISMEPVDYDINTINDSIEINYIGYGYVRFRIADKDNLPLVSQRVDYCFEDFGENGKGSATTDAFGILEIKTPELVSTKAIPETRTLKVKLNGYGDYYVNVKILPLSYRQSWEGMLSVGMGVSAGLQLGVTAGPLQVEAKLAAIGADVSKSQGIRIEDSYSNGKRTLAINHILGMDGSVEGDVGFSTKISEEKKKSITETAKSDTAVSLSAGQATSEAGISVSCNRGIRIEDYDPENSDHIYKIGVFLLDSTILRGISTTANALRAILNEELKYYHNEEYVQAGAKIGFAANAGMAGIGKNSAAAVGLSESAVLTYRYGFDKDNKVKNYNQIYDASNIDIGNFKLGYALEDSELNVGASYKETYSYLSNNFLNNKASIETTKSNNKLEKIAIKSLEKNNVNFWDDTPIDTIEQKIEFEGEQAHNVTYSNPDLSRFVNEDNVFISSTRMANAINEAFSSGYQADYTRTRIKEDANSIEVPIEVKALAGVKFSFGISGKYQMDYDMEKGLMGNKKFYKTSYSTPDEAINLHRKSLVDILKEPIDFIKNVIVDNLETISGAIQDGIEFGKAKIKGAFDNIYVSITGFKKNLNLQSFSLLCVEDEAALTSTASLATTVGEPYIVTFLDERGNEVAEIYENKYTLTLFFDEQDLAGAGISDNYDYLSRIKIYRWDAEKQVYVCVGGILDSSNSGVSAEISKVGEYILAVDNCPPLITDFGTSNSTVMPEFTAMISDLSGISSFEFRIDGDLLVDNTNFEEYYSYSTSKFSYKPKIALDEGKHSATIFASDTSGNVMSSLIKMEFTVDSELPVISEITIPKVAYNNEISISAMVSDSNIGNVTMYIEYNGTVYSYTMYKIGKNYSKTVYGLPKNEYVKIYVGVTDISGNYTESSVHTVYCIGETKLDNDLYIHIANVENKVACVVTGNYDRSLDCVLAVAGYNNGILKEIKMAEYELTEEYQEFNFAMEGIYDSYKVFCWDAKSKIIPLCKSKYFVKKSE